MLKIKRAILIAIPPLLTVAFLGYAYYRHHKMAAELDIPPIVEESYSQKKLATTEKRGTDTVEKLPENVAESFPKTTAELLIERDAKTEKLTIAEAETRIAELAAPLSKLPLWQKILAQSQLLRRFVAALDTIALGKRPVEQLDFLHPEKTFTAEKKGVYWQQSDISQQRFSPLVQLFCEMSPTAIAKLYCFLEPALQEACDGLGYRDKPVRTLLTDACTVVLSTPIPEKEPLLTGGGKKGVFYWQNQDLEALNDAQKLFLRMGSKNAMLARQQLEAIATELSLYQQ